jgi:hypothetical protein
VRASFAWGFNRVALIPLFAILVLTGRARPPVPWGWIGLRRVAARC